jgi:ATP-dependent Clp protease ATP-binding subunit ClpA
MTASDLQPPISAVLMRSLRIASASGAAATGFVHLVAALADDDSTVVAHALRAGGLDHAALSDLVARKGSATPPTHGVTHSPRVRWTLGVAHGLALAAGAEEDPTHVLLALLYDSSDEAAGVWHRVGVDPARVGDHLAQTGIKTPTTPLPTPRTPDEKQTITFDAPDRRPVLQAMFHAYPLGSTLRWGWNLLDDNRCYVRVEDPARMPEALAVIRSAVADPDRIGIEPCKISSE